MTVFHACMPSRTIASPRNSIANANTVCRGTGGQPELEVGVDAEVPTASSPNCPEQVGFRACVCAHDPTIGKDHVAAYQRVTCCSGGA